tara:strand:- start:291 stop:740 length:450 start_codon:yes stop_codon:yes gene_type:complete
MDETMTLIFTGVGGILVLLSVYGAFKMDRKLFLSGVCYFSLLPIIGETMRYMDPATSSPYTLTLICTFIAQFLLTRPDDNNYGMDNTAAVALATKIGLAILAINLGSAYVILCLDFGVAQQFGYYHLVISLSILYFLYRRFTGEGISWK